MKKLNNNTVNGMRAEALEMVDNQFGWIKQTVTACYLYCIGIELGEFVNAYRKELNELTEGYLLPAAFNTKDGEVTAIKSPTQAVDRYSQGRYAHLNQSEYVRLVTTKAGELPYREVAEYFEELGTEEAVELFGYGLPALEEISGRTEVDYDGETLERMNGVEFSEYLTYAEVDYLHSQHLSSEYTTSGKRKTYAETVKFRIREDEILENDLGIYLVDLTEAREIGNFTEFEGRTNLTAYPLEVFISDNETETGYTHPTRYRSSILSALIMQNRESVRMLDRLYVSEFGELKGRYDLRELTTGHVTTSGKNYTDKNTQMNLKPYITKENDKATQLNVAPHRIVAGAFLRFPRTELPEGVKSLKAMNLTEFDAHHIQGKLPEGVTDKGLLNTADNLVLLPAKTHRETHKEGRRLAKGEKVTRVNPLALINATEILAKNQK